MTENNNTDTNEDDFSQNNKKTSELEDIPLKSDEVPENTDGRGFMSAFMPVYQVNLSHFRFPIYISLLFSGILALLISNVGLQGLIPEENAASGLGQGLLLTASAVVSSIVIVFVVKKKGENALKYIMSFAFLLLTFMLLYFFGMFFVDFIVLGDSMLFQVVFNIYTVFSGVITVYFVFMFFSGRMGPKLKNFYVIMVGILIGAFMGVIMPPWTTITMLIGISLWDIFSVRSSKGPIRKILELTGGLEQSEIEIDEETFRSTQVEIGIGDLAFYSQLTSAALVFMVDFMFGETGNVITSVIFGLIVALTAAIGILIGSTITINSLRKNKILPGLPLSIFIGMGFAFLSGLYVFLNFLFFQ